MNKKLIIANWKMLPESLAQAQEILESMDNYLGSLEDSPAGEKSFSLVICPPFVFTEEIGKTLKTSHLEHSALLGAQDIASEEKAALTGEVSGSMLEKLGVSHIIIGHSERRWKLGESDGVVNKKLKTALEKGFIPVVCIGERVRDDKFETFLKEQIFGTFKDLNQNEIGRCIVAYEPVWAISTNPGARPDTPESALESIRIIRSLIKPRSVLYGGSVNSKNAGDFLKENEIDGVLVGGASVNKDEFVKILQITSRV